VDCLHFARRVTAENRMDRTMSTRVSAQGLQLSSPVVYPSYIPFGVQKVSLTRLDKKARSGYKGRSHVISLRLENESACISGHWLSFR